MKILTFLSTLFLIIVLAGCNTDTQQQDNKKNTEDKITKKTQENDKNSSIENSKEKKENENKEKNKNTLKENTEERKVDKNNNKKEESSTESTEEKKHKNRNKSNLSNYTSKQIEYARIWYQIADTNNIKHLSIDTLPKGSQIFPTSKNKAHYDENITRLTGGSYGTKNIEYSSNGDGTINYYHLSHYKMAGKIGRSTKQDKNLEKKYKKNVKKVKIKPYKNKEIVKLIKKEQYLGNIRK